MANPLYFDAQSVITQRLVKQPQKVSKKPWSRETWQTKEPTRGDGYLMGVRINMQDAETGAPVQLRGTTVELSFESDFGPLLIFGTPGDLTPVVKKDDTHKMYCRLEKVYRVLGAKRTGETFTLDGPTWRNADDWVCEKCEEPMYASWVSCPACNIKNPMLKPGEARRRKTRWLRVESGEEDDYGHAEVCEPEKLDEYDFVTGPELTPAEIKEGKKKAPPMNLKLSIEMEYHARRVWLLISLPTRYRRLENKDKGDKEQDLKEWTEDREMERKMLKRLGSLIMNGKERQERRRQEEESRKLPPRERRETWEGEAPQRRLSQGWGDLGLRSVGRGGSRFGKKAVVHRPGEAQLPAGFKRHLLEKEKGDADEGKLKTVDEQIAAKRGRRNHIEMAALLKTEEEKQKVEAERRILGLATPAETPADGGVTRAGSSPAEAAAVPPAPPPPMPGLGLRAGWAVPPGAKVSAGITRFVPKARQEPAASAAGEGSIDIDEVQAP